MLCLDTLKNSSYYAGTMSADLLVRQPGSDSTLLPVKPILTKDLVETVIERIIELLGAGILKAEEKIPSEKKLMAAFGVGRSSIRESLRSLVAMNLLETRPGKGYYVSPLAPSLINSELIKPGKARAASFYEIMEARKVLELAIADLALCRATEEDHLEVKRTGDDLLEAAEKRAPLLPYTMRVHLAIAKAAHNAFLKRLFTDLLPWIMGRFTPVHVPSEADLQMHLRLMDAFLSQDRELLTSAIENHHVFWSTKYVARFAPDEEPLQSVGGQPINEGGD